MITLSFYGSLAPNFLLLRVLHDFFFSALISLCLFTRRSEPGEHREVCRRGEQAGARRRSELPDQQCGHQRGGRLSFCYRRDDDRKLPHQHCGSSNDH